MMTDCRNQPLRRGQLAAHSDRNGLLHLVQVLTVNERSVLVMDVDTRAETYLYSKRKVMIVGQDREVRNEDLSARGTVFEPEE